MSATSTMLLLGLGTSGVRIARDVSANFDGEIRLALADTDVSSAADGQNFTLIGGERLSGRGAGGDVVAARLATEDSIHHLDSIFEGVRLVTIVTSLGGGTGAGATLEVLNRLATLGIPSIVFATLPFSFEGEARQRNARGYMTMIEDAANATFFLPLEKLVGETDNMTAALERATATVAEGVTLFWRLVEKPGYLKLDAERIRHLIQAAGRGRFAAVTCEGPSRAAEAADRLIRSELLATANGPVNAILCGVLAGEDLRLSELETLSSGIRESFGEHVTFDLATVNDEERFSGKLSAVVMLFERNGRGGKTGAKRKDAANPLASAPTGRGRFKNAEQTLWHGEDLDTPTFIRQGISLEY